MSEVLLTEGGGELLTHPTGLYPDFTPRCTPWWAVHIRLFIRSKEIKSLSGSLRTGFTARESELLYRRKMQGSFVMACCLNLIVVLLLSNMMITNISAHG